MTTRAPAAPRRPRPAAYGDARPYTGRMATFTVGEEVLFEDERFVIAAIEPGGARRCRLLATTASGARVVWAPHAKLQKMTRYTQSRDDTQRVTRKP